MGLCPKPFAWQILEILLLDYIKFDIINWNLKK